MSNLEWHDDYANLGQVAVNLLQEKKFIQSSCCEKPEVHCYADKGRLSKSYSNLACVWVWCSSCGAFQHLDGFQVPEDWQNCDEVNWHKLTAVPEYQESIKNIIDCHMNKYLISKEELK